MWTPSSGTQIMEAVGYCVLSIFYVQQKRPISAPGFVLWCLGVLD